MKNFQQALDAALRNLSGRKGPQPVELNPAIAGDPLKMKDLTPVQQSLRRIANLGVGLGVARDTLMTQNPMEREAATQLWRSIPDELKAELKLQLSFTDDDKVQFVMKSGKYVEACMREFHGESPKSPASGQTR